ncbi:MAG: hypothetical protein OXU20_35775 [Myxococcales bacterium]|nr:hypothetical protein [Myxococcales bacterium]
MHDTARDWVTTCTYSADADLPLGECDDGTRLNVLWAEDRATTDRFDLVNFVEASPGETRELVVTVVSGEQTLRGATVEVVYQSMTRARAECADVCSIGQSTL